MIANLLNIHKEPKFKPDLNRDEFQTFKTHTNKIYNPKNYGVDYLNIKMDITKPKNTGGDLSGTNNDHLKTFNVKGKQIENPFNFMGGKIDIPEWKISAPYLWRQPNTKELIISRLQNENGFGNALSGKLINFNTEGDEIIPTTDVGRDAGFNEIMQKLNNVNETKNKESVTKKHFEGLAMDPINETPPPKPPRVNRTPLKVQSVLTSQPSQVTHLTNDDLEELQRDNEEDKRLLEEYNKKKIIRK